MGPAAGSRLTEGSRGAARLEPAPVLSSRLSDTAPSASARSRPRGEQRARGEGERARARGRPGRGPAPARGRGPGRRRPCRAQPAAPPSGGPKEPGFETQLPCCFTEGASNLTLLRQCRPQPRSPLALHAAQLRSRPAGTAGRGRAGALRAASRRPSAPQPLSLAAFLPGCVAARSAEARLPVATTRRRFAAGDAAVAAGTAAASCTSGSGICSPGAALSPPPQGLPGSLSSRSEASCGLGPAPAAHNGGAGSARRALRPPRGVLGSAPLPGALLTTVGRNSSSVARSPGSFFGVRHRMVGKKAVKTSHRLPFQSHRHKEKRVWLCLLLVMAFPWAGATSKHF